MNLKEWLADRRITLHERTPQGAVAKLAAECKEQGKHLASLAKGESKPIGPDNGPVIDSRNMPAPVLRDTRGIKVRTAASKYARHGEKLGLVHSVSHTDKATGVVTTQIVCYDAYESVALRDGLKRDATAAYAASHGAKYRAGNRKGNPWDRLKRG